MNYTYAGGNIRIAVKRLEDVVRVTVEDAGIGIPVAELPYIFDRYYRGDHPVLNVSGLSLGLFTSKEIIASHHGEIGADSWEGKGSTFWFS